MNRMIKEIIAFIVSHIIDIIVSSVLTMIYAIILNKTGYDLKMIFITVLTFVFFVASLFVVSANQSHNSP